MPIYWTPAAEPGPILIIISGRAANGSRATWSLTPTIANVGVGDKAAIVHISHDGTKLSHDRECDLVDMPGGGVKFTIRFDRISGLYWTLGSKQTNPEAKRNTLVLASSSDLRHWTAESTLLHHDDPEFHAFQYVDWVVESDDIIFLSRTAYEDGLGGAHTQHDSNYLTFHRLSDFRISSRTLS